MKVRKVKLLTKYRRQPIPDSSDFHKTSEDSKTSMEKTAPEMAPTAAPLTNPLSVSWPIKAPVIAPNKVPTAKIYHILILDFYKKKMMKFLCL